MVKLKFRLRLKRLTRPKSRTQYDFKQSEQTDQYRLELSNKFQLLAELGDSESENDSQGIGTGTEQVWQRLKVSILDSARETLSVKRTQPWQPNQAWITPETLALIDEKRSCSRDSDHYRRLKRQVRSSLRRDKRTHLEGMCEEMEEYQKRNDSKGMFATVNRLTKQACPTAEDDSCMLPLSPPKGVSKTQNGRFSYNKSDFGWRKSATKFLCVKTVSGIVVGNSLA